MAYRAEMQIGIYEHPSVIERFFSKVKFSGGCWEWMACKNKTGYGKFCSFHRVTVYSHRFSYELIIGKIPEELQLDHLCHNRACVNPHHLEPVTHRVNILRGEGFVAREARKTHCPKGHLLSGDNLVKAQLKCGKRVCRICQNTRALKRYHELSGTA